MAWYGNLEKLLPNAVCILGFTFLNVRQKTDANSAEIVPLWRINSPIKA